MATLLIGYDVERPGAPDLTRTFLSAVRRVHGDLQAPCTFFLLGQVVEERSDDLAPLVGDPLFDMQQHTYSHLLLKTVCLDDGEKITLVRGGTLDQVDDELGRANAIIKERLGVECTGLTGPWCYYRGLMDRPDLLEIVDRHGLRFLRTFGRNEKDFQPVPFEWQPFFYEPQGFPDILECMIHGWQDVHWKMIWGYDNLDAYLAHLRECVDAVAETDLVLSYGTHDWSSIEHDPELTVVRGLIEYAQRRGMRLLTYGDYYRERIAGRNAAQ